ncbi:tRNA 2-selenouridine(34) synthase MnmH [Malikia spinosa]|uniref:tRNA 2-selenouridine synthase n=1 Tax=Malikia spinosa TaxID=86180 RepID=A0A2S9KC31_9BURK|nr:tRNA 2-selenouridine(34) synthase MnmH [Malikia spinosa]PRD67997.1 tRNA 2-selenouridine(34) synthase MnmH [Malikia spinosa]
MPELTDEYRQIFLRGVPMLDLRAPVEFAQGAFPGAVNLPLMSDEERARVGTCYKQQGQDAAIKLGHQLVSGPLRAQRMAAWADFVRQHPDGVLYCFRGGLRSQTVQRWLHEAGIDYPRVIGGYKAMRTFLIETIEQAATECELIVVGGMTGTGKTDVIAQLPHAIDLEGLANHRGSAFGKRSTPQPTNIEFENRVAIDILRKREAGISQFVVEDESRAIGSCSLPLPLHGAMQTAPLVWLEDSFENRVERILRDYVVSQLDDHLALHGPEQGFERYAEQLLKSLAGITKRLGGERYQRLHTIMQEALVQQQSSGEVVRHRDWIAGLLREYYDPMYAFQRESKGARIVFAGEQAAVVEFLRERAHARSSAA